MEICIVVVFVVFVVPVDLQSKQWPFAGDQHSKDPGAATNKKLTR